MVVEKFLFWLSQKNIDEKELPLIRAGAEKILFLAEDGEVFPKHIDLMISQAEAEQYSANQMAIFKKTGDLLLEFQEDLRAPNRAPSGENKPLAGPITSMGLKRYPSSMINPVIGDGGAAAPRTVRPPSGANAPLAAGSGSIPVIQRVPSASFRPIEVTPSPTEAADRQEKIIAHFMSLVFAAVSCAVIFLVGKYLKIGMGWRYLAAIIVGLGTWRGFFIYYLKLQQKKVNDRTSRQTRR